MSVPFDDVLSQVAHRKVADSYHGDALPSELRGPGQDRITRALPALIPDHARILLAVINILVTRLHRYTVDAFVHGPGRELPPLAKALPYEDMVGQSILDPGCYLFGDIDRLRGASLKFAVELHSRLISEPGFTVLNDPTHSLTRYRLLRELERRGINAYRARRLKEADELSFPVFIRRDEHEGPLTGLLHTREDLEDAVERLFVDGYSPRRLLIVEFIDTSDEDGLFRKYSAFRIGDRIVPRGLWFRREWPIRQPGFADEAKLREEMDYLESNPHEAVLRPIFELARIDYGRVDYGLHNGNIVVWEINTNPMLPDFPLPENLLHQIRRRAKLFSVDHTAAALAALDEATDHAMARPIPIGRRRWLGARLIGSARLGEIARAVEWSRPRVWMGRIGRGLRRLLKPFVHRIFAVPNPREWI